MPFLSIEFIAFFVAFFPIYWMLQKRPIAQNWLLIIANLLLLAYLHIGFAVSVGVFSLFMAFIAHRIRLEKTHTKKKTLLIIGISSAIGLLAFFKYLDFFKPVMYQLGLQQFADIFMPLGMSYYVFQSVALLVSVYQGKSATLKWYEILLHLSFFLTITAGPIIRSENFKSIDGINIGAREQIQRPRKLTKTDLAIALILLGVAKTLWLSAHIAGNVVEPIFDNPLQYGSSSILLAVYGYTLQLFFNFSGYSDLAIGFALLLGFHLPNNFKAPLYARNIKEFWARWHISLSTWIRDYIYIPLGGNRKGFWWAQINIAVAFVLSGIWHGSSWNFALWGALHSFALVFLNIKTKYWKTQEPSPNWLNEIKNYMAIVVTFNFVCFAFVVFNIPELSNIADFFNALINSENENKTGDIILIVSVYLWIFCYPLWINIFRSFVQLLHNLPILIKAVVILIILQIIIELSPSGIPSFIYASF